jgi:hypothetical protein
MDEAFARKRIVYRYEKHPEYRVVFANGAVGGATPRGDVKFDLFLEYLEVPEQSVHSLTPDGIGPEIERSPKDSPFTRQSQVGVVMSPGQAKALAYWLMGQVEQMEKKRGPGSPSGN